MFSFACLSVAIKYIQDKSLLLSEKSRFWFRLLYQRNKALDDIFKLGCGIGNPLNFKDMGTE